MSDPIDLSEDAVKAAVAEAMRQLEHVADVICDGIDDLQSAADAVYNNAEFTAALAPLRAIRRAREDRQARLMEALWRLCNEGQLPYELDVLLRNEWAEDSSFDESGCRPDPWHGLPGGGVRFLPDED
jgi:hypothetical protein